MLLTINAKRTYRKSPSKALTHKTYRNAEMLIGSMLGDGCLFHHQYCKHPYFYIARKLQDYEYLDYQFQLFKDFCNRDKLKTYEIYDKRTNKTYYQCKFVTRSAAIFDNYYAEWYGSGRKALPERMELTPLVCATWFFDDGCIIVDKRNSRLRIKLATHCFSIEENQRLVAILKDMFSEHFSLPHDGKKVFIVSSDAGTKKFIEFIKPCVHPSMKRKIVWTQEQLEQPRTRPQLKNRNPLDMNDRSRAVLLSLKQRDATPKSIANNINWTRNGETPSGLTMYLNRFLEYKWVEKYGTPHSYKDTIKYRLTGAGRAIAEQLIP